MRLRSERWKKFKERSTLPKKYWVVGCALTVYLFFPYFYSRLLNKYITNVNTIASVLVLTIVMSF